MASDLFFPHFYDMSVMAAVVISAVLLLRLLLHRLPKRLMMLLWAVVLFRLLCPVTVESTISLIPQQLDTLARDAALEERALISTGAAASAAYRALGDAANGGLDILSVPLDRADVADPQSQLSPTVSAYHHQVWLLLLGKLWLWGAVLLLLVSLIPWVRLRRLTAVSVPLRDIPSPAYTRLPHRVLLADGLPTAFVIGLIRPGIYLPSSLTAEEQRLILAHEQVHLRHGDHIWKALAFLALCLHWFNPLVWIAFFAAARDMELFCDETAAALLSRDSGDDSRADYAAALLRLSARNGHRFTSLAFGEGSTSQRIRRLLRQKQPHRLTIVLACILCFGVIAACAVNPHAELSADDAVYISLDGEALPLTRAESLIALINGHSRTTNLQYDGISERSLDHTARLEFSDGSYVLLNYRYVSGYSFHPAHPGEDDYKSILWYFNTDGIQSGTWVMEYDFDAAFRDWMRKPRIISVIAMQTADVPYARFAYDENIDYDDVPTLSAPDYADFILMGFSAGQTVTVSEDYYAVVGSTSTQIQRQTLTLTADDYGNCILPLRCKNPGRTESAVYFIGGDDARYVFRAVFGEETDGTQTE